MVKHCMGQLSPLPDGITHDSAMVALKRLVSDQLVTSESHSAPGGYEIVYRIAPGANSAIEELLV